MVGLTLLNALQNLKSAFKPQVYRLYLASVINGRFHFEKDYRQILKYPVVWLHCC